MRNVFLTIIAAILLISCNYKDIKLNPNDKFYHEYGSSISKWIVVDTIDEGVLAYSERWLPELAIYVSYSDLSMDSKFRRYTGKTAFEINKDSSYMKVGDTFLLEYGYNVYKWKVIGTNEQGYYTIRLNQNWDKRVTFMRFSEMNHPSYKLTD